MICIWDCQAAERSRLFFRALSPRVVDAFGIVRPSLYPCTDHRKGKYSVNIGECALLDAAAKRDTSTVMAGLIWCRDTIIVNFPSNADVNISFVCLDCYASADCGKWCRRKAYYFLATYCHRINQPACLHTICIKISQMSFKKFQDHSLGMQT